VLQREPLERLLVWCVEPSAETEEYMIIDQQILDSLTAAAKASPRLRMNYYLRNTLEDGSQRMLNAIEPGTVMPIHRHRSSSETVVCVRGHFEEYLYDDSGTLVEMVDMVPGGNVLNVPAMQWHSLRSLESGTVLLECKDGRWELLGEGDVMG
jgi:cupin fold WbuC family metalloprotein